MEIILIKEKETPGTWRFKEDKADRPMTIYLTKEQVKELGSPEINQDNNHCGIYLKRHGFLNCYPSCHAEFSH